MFNLFKNWYNSLGSCFVTSTGLYILFHSALTDTVILFSTAFLYIFWLTIFHYEVGFYIYFSPKGLVCALFSELFQSWEWLPVAFKHLKKKMSGWIHFLSLRSQWTVFLYLLVFSVAVESSGSNWFFHVVSDLLFLAE